MSQKRCIFHIPNAVNPNGISGSQVRPMKLWKAFEAIGYTVDAVMGDNAQRKVLIKAIKENIRNGILYDFLYSESSTMPTLLTDKSHLPTHPFMDFGLMKFCRANGIKVGLFYRDIYWKFADYKALVPWYQRAVTLPMYKYDLTRYNKDLDRLYLPSMRMKKYIEDAVHTQIDELPPGADYNEDNIQRRKQYFAEEVKQNLELFYVGGVSEQGGIYDLTMLVKILKNKKNVHLTICCRENEWLKNKKYYEEYLTDRISIVHKSGKELQVFYLKSDICMCYFPSGGYRDMAMPIKVFEYLSYVTPMIITKGCVAGTFVEKNDIGWSVEYKEQAIETCIDEILANRADIIKKHENAVRCLEANTWLQRARKIVADLAKEE